MSRARLIPFAAAAYPRQGTRRKRGPNHDSAHRAEQSPARNRFIFFNDVPSSITNRKDCAAALSVQSLSVALASELSHWPDAREIYSRESQPFCSSVADNSSVPLLNPAKQSPQLAQSSSTSTAILEFFPTSTGRRIVSARFFERLARIRRLNPFHDAGRGTRFGVKFGDALLLRGRECCVSRALAESSKELFR